ncbi:titin-like [Mugil cephalus]|uniref:titin-like n=1 Tax=Mugil cephalus TaxID=48193 RepID=UPI001FB6C193|nr:titin-like [Mugil cephalus]
MWLFEVSCVLYLAAVCAAQTVSSPTQTQAVTTTPIVPPKPELKTQWLDVFAYEKVTFRCTISESLDRTFVWKRDGTEITTGSDPSLSLTEDGSVLTITATPLHAGSYSCSVRSKNVEGPSSESLTLNVNPNKPKPTIRRSSNYDEMFPGESISFTCSIEVSTGWEYLWYHNGQKMDTNGNTYPISTINDSNKGQYHCKASRGSFYTDNSDSTSLKVSNPPSPVLKHQNPWLDVFEGETLEFRCEVEGTGWTYIWFRDKHQLQNGPNIDEDKGILNIGSVSQTDAGNYMCKAQIISRGVITEFSNSASVIVYKTIPTPTLSKVPAFDKMYFGEMATFTCKVDVATGWTYWWYLDGTQYRDDKEGKEEILSLGPSDAGDYTCKATRGKISTVFSDKITQVVVEPPVPALKNVTQWLDVFPTENVTFSCVMPENSPWTYLWFKDMVQIQAGQDWSFNPNGALTIASASAKHGGKYTCRRQLQDRAVISNASSPLTLRVYDQKPTVSLTRAPALDVMFPGEQVTFSCNIGSSSGWEYLWYKNSIPVKASERSYSINLSGAADSGPYTCQAKRGSNAVFTTDSSQVSQLQVKEIPVPDLDRDSQWPDVFLTESVKLKCGMKTHSELWTYTWYKDSQVIEASNHVSFDEDRTTLSISSASPEHSGSYRCSGKLKRGLVNSTSSSELRLKPREIPVPVLDRVTPWPDVFPNETVKLRCGMKTDSKLWTYTWYKDSDVIKASNHVSFDEDRTTLSISFASSKHNGSYRCSGNLKYRYVSSTSSSELPLEVYDEKPKVTLIREPDYDQMHTGDSVSFTCHVNVSSGWEYEWHKGESLFPTSGNQHKIESVQKKDSGSYTCRVKRGLKSIFYSRSQPSVINVEERPQASLVLLTGWSEVFSTDSLVLKCEVMESQDNWNYTWYKEETKIADSHSEKHTVTPQNDPDQSHYVCEGNRVGRPSYSKKSDSFKTKNLLLKRRVLLSISGCLFFGIIGVFLGCIILRVFRKPASNDDKNEEDNLFLTMAQQKGCDAPCPLAVYITDASLNAPAKEGDENGTICSETTPLPITTQEDQAVTPDSQETTETNGGLLSFQK